MFWCSRPKQRNTGEGGGECGRITTEEDVLWLPESYCLPALGVQTGQNPFSET